MAIVQISRITNRKGLQENLPQLAGAELGWCTDTRRLFIGNGRVGDPPNGDGAPEIGNTEILTEFSEFIPPPTVVELLNNQAAPAILITEDLNNTKVFTVEYSIIRGTAYRTGTFRVAAGSVSGAITFDDNFIENSLTGITLVASQNDSTIYVQYTSTNTGIAGTIAFVVTKLF